MLADLFIQKLFCPRMFFFNYTQKEIIKHAQIF